MVTFWGAALRWHIREPWLTSHVCVGREVAAGVSDEDDEAFYYRVLGPARTLGPASITAVYAIGVPPVL